MTLSKTSRILLAILLCAAAIFVWVNFFYGEPPVEDALLGAAPAPAVEGPVPSSAAPTAGAAAAPPVVAPEPVVARDLVVADLPFLVTGPQALEATGESGAAADAAESGRPTAGPRLTVNPFSPVLVRQPEPQVIAQAPSDTQPVITEVAVPSAPSNAAAVAAPAPVVRAPTPRPLAPASPQARNLPRSLPGQILGGTPDILRQARSSSEIPGANLAQVAAIREPATADVPLENLAHVDAEIEAPAPLPEPVATLREPRVGAVSASRDPLVAGISPLSRYLRDNDFNFTGAVLGPVSVGVFRSSVTSAPVVISLGQSLPDTEIVLTDLRGQQAELTLGEASQILTLDLRR